jgi:hypothetical protein
MQLAKPYNLMFAFNELENEYLLYNIVVYYNLKTLKQNHQLLPNHFFRRYCLAHPIPIHSSGVDDDAVLASGSSQRAQDEETPIQTLLPRMVRMVDGSGSLHGFGLQVSLLKRYFHPRNDKSYLA